MRLALKVTASIGLILALSIATSVVVSRHAFVRILLDLTESRIVALADDLGDVFEATIRLGLPLDEMGNGSDILAAALPLDPQVVALAVVGAQGEVLHQTGRAFDWSRPVAQRGEADLEEGQPAQGGRYRRHAGCLGKHPRSIGQDDRACRYRRFQLLPKYAGQQQCR